MQSKKKNRMITIIRWCIPFLCVTLCLCFRFPRFLLQVLTIIFGFGISCALFCTKRRIIKSDSTALIIFLLLFLLIGFYASIVYGVRHTQYKRHDLDQNVFKEKRILVMVPHQDDEINLFGGLYEIFEEDSEVFVVFSTNGDKRVSGETRIREATAALDKMGIDRNHIFFLGYGDSCTDMEGTHIYNLPGDEIAISFAERTETYASYGFQPYRHSSYTRNNMKNDMTALLLELKPDVIFCIDFDAHHDHRALSLLFEESMGEILRRNHNDYIPSVFKGFGYSTAYLGEPDFYADNIRSTVPYSQEYPYPGNYYADENDVRIFYKGENHIYLWNSRLRFPVSESVLSRTLHSSSLYEAMRSHQSQNELYEALASLQGIINGDKVFWLRETSGLLYQADVSVSSGSGSVLTDFKLTDSSDLFDKERKPFENLWIPDPEDNQKTAVFSFGRETAIDSIRLYDNPSLSDNITRIRIQFSDGSRMECGPLEINGSATTVQFEEKVVSSFSVQLLESEGNQPGLSEVEVYHHYDPRDFVPEWIKLQDQNGDFIYDYWITDHQEVFSVYNSLDSFTTYVPGEYSLQVLSGSCEITRNEDGSFSVSCAKGCSAELALYKSGEKTPVDLVTVRNPLSFEIWWNTLLIEAEKNLDLYSPSEQYLYFKETMEDYWQKLPFVHAG